MPKGYTKITRGNKILWKIQVYRSGNLLYGGVYETETEAKRYAKLMIKELDAGKRKKTKADEMRDNHKLKIKNILRGQKPQE